MLTFHEASSDCILFGTPVKQNRCLTCPSKFGCAKAGCISIFLHSLLPFTYSIFSGFLSVPHGLLGPGPGPVPNGFPPGPKNMQHFSPGGPGPMPGK